MPDAAQFRDVIGRFPTGVAIITCQGPDGPAGLTTNAITSLSLDPLLVLVCFDNDARTLPIVRDVGRFGLNMLRADQGTLSRVFASKLPEHEKFAGVPHHIEDGVPIIEGTLAWMTCDLEELHPGGDHTIGVGAVRAMMPGDAHGDPLVWYRGDYRGIV